MSSWKDQQTGNYGSVYDMDWEPTYVCGDWELTFGAYIDEDTNSFWFDEDPEGGTGGTSIGAIAYLENVETGAVIRFPFDIYYHVFGDVEDPDEFYLEEPDRSLDHDEGIRYNIDDVDGIDEADAKEFVEDNLQEIFDAIIDVVNQNLYKFGYEL